MSKEFIRRHKDTIGISAIGAVLVASYFPAIVHKLSPFHDYSIACDSFNPQFPPNESYAALTVAPQHWYDRIPDAASLPNAERFVQDGGCGAHNFSAVSIGTVMCTFVSNRQPEQTSFDNQRELLCIVELHTRQ